MKKEGVLVEDKQRKKFYIVYDDMTESNFLSCGSPLDACIDYEWYEGRVEAADGRYYFYGDTKVFLYTGMRVSKSSLGHL